MTARHSTLFTLRSGHSGLGIYTTQRDAASEAGDILWTDAQAREHHLNPCKTIFNNAKRIQPPSPDLSELNLGSGQTNSGYFYIGDNGGISKHRNGAIQAFRIINRENSKDFKLARLNTDLSLLDDAQNNSSFRLSVEAVVYRNGQSNEVVSSTILQEDFSVIPKGCRLSFGSHQNLTSNTLRGHGNSSCPLNRFELAINRCMFTGLDPDGYGIVVGAGGEGGFIEADGATIKNLQGMAVNPVYCLSADPTECTAANNSSGNQMERLDIKLPTPPRYPGNWGDEKSAPMLSPCSAAACPSNASGASGSNQLMQYNSTTLRSIFNAAAVTDATQLPSNCTLHRNDIHCIYRGIDLSGSINNLVFVSGKNIRRIRLYFPTAGNVISQSLASGTLTHCKVESCSGPGAFVDNTTDVSFFGSACPYDPAKPNQCGQQDLIIKGSVNQARFFIFAPQATIKIIGTGTATFQGVIWSRGLKMKGTTAIPSIPKTGVADVFHLMGILPDENNTFSKSLTGNATTTNLFPWDMVARSTSRYRFFGN